MSKIDFEKIPNREKARRLRKEYIDRELQISKEKELQKILNLTYRYFRFWYKSKEVSVSVGYIADESPFGCVVKYSIALQSKNDQFNRKEARKYINKRWNEIYISEFEIDFKTRDISSLIAIHYNSKQYTPKEYGIEMIPKYLQKIPISFYF